jgi:predicted CXXCH cytochrome family protein
MGWMHWKTGLASLAVAVTVALVGLGTSQPVHAQIKGTKHNLGTTPGGTGVNQFSGTAEICVFCHTPHGADTSAAVPLWNRTLPLPASFTTYDSLGTSSLDGKTAPVGSVSIACLSCHDGVTSMSAVINAPGSGTAGDAAWTAGSWSGANQTTGKLAAGLITNLGTDLKNDHPIGIQYGGGGITITAPAAATKDPDFKVPASAVLGSTRVWWVDTEAVANTTRQKTDMLLYTRTAATGYTGQTEAEPFVECASCHDPHSTNATFLRISNAGSAVCLACHVK